jgi:hypothetical protein
VDSSRAAQEHAVRDAETIVCLAWAEVLLARRDFSALALVSARQGCQAASDRFAMAQRCGDPGRISLAHAMLEDALGVHRATEVASDRVRQALKAVLGSLVRTKEAYRIAAARQVRGGGSMPATAPAATSDLSVWQAPSGGGGLKAVRLAFRRVGRFLARRVPGPGQP